MNELVELIRTDGGRGKKRGGGLKGGVGLKRGRTTQGGEGRGGGGKRVERVVVVRSVRAYWFRWWVVWWAVSVSVRGKGGGGYGKVFGGDG